MLLTGSIGPYAWLLVDALSSRGHFVGTAADGEPSLVGTVHHVPVLPTGDQAADQLAAMVDPADVVIVISALGPISAMVANGTTTGTVLHNLRSGGTLIYTSSLGVLGAAAGHGVAIDETFEPAADSNALPQRADELRTLRAGDWLRTVVIRPGIVYRDGAGRCSAARCTSPEHPGSATTSATATTSTPPSTFAT